MACNYYSFSLSNVLRLSLPSSGCQSLTCFSVFPPQRVTRSMPFATQDHAATAAVPTQLSSTEESFSWDDVVKIAELEDDPFDLSGYFDKVRACNRNPDKQLEFIPFVIDGQVIGYIHHRFADILRGFQDVFLFAQNGSYAGFFGGHITLSQALITPQERTIAVENAIRSLGEELIPGRRNELFPVVSSYGTREFFSMERAAAACFGIKTYCLYVNGYVERDGEQFMWIAKRSPHKPLFPGRLDFLVAGGLPHGISCRENMIKECEEEAGISLSMCKEAKAAGAVSYVDIDGYRYKREVHFCYDLRLPEDFIPENLDGEVESFKLIPITLVANVLKRRNFFRTNCSLGIIDFLFRHGYISHEATGYLKLLQGIRSGDCS